MLPTFHTNIDSLHYGVDATEVYHDRSECHIGALIRLDHNEQMGRGDRRRCKECQKYGTV